MRQMRSDQGTNFMGAKELKEALGELDRDKIGKELLQNNCDWFCFKMNVPSASHMGGIWERQIRSVRNVLSVLLENNGDQLDDESLSTFMCKAEAIINSRPLTVDGLADPDSLTPLNAKSSINDEIQDRSFTSRKLPECRHTQENVGGTFNTWQTSFGVAGRKNTFTPSS